MATIARDDDVEDVEVTHETFDEPKGPKALTDDELLGITSFHMQRAVAFCTEQLGRERNNAMRYYLGLPEGDLAPPAVPDRSAVVSTDVSDTIEWLLPALLSIFTAGPSVVEFVPRKEGDEDAAEQVTEYLNYIFYQQNDGWNQLYTWFKDSLIQKVGVMKVYWDGTPEVVTEFYRGLTEMQFVSLLEDDTVEPIEHTAYPDPAALHRAQAQYAYQTQEYARQQAMIHTLMNTGWPEQMAKQAASAAGMQRNGPQQRGANVDPQQQAQDQAKQQAAQAKQQQQAAQQAQQAAKGAKDAQEDAQIKQQLGQQPPQPPGQPGMGQPPGAGPAGPQAAPQGAGGPPQPPQLPGAMQQPQEPPEPPLMDEPAPVDPSTLPQLHDIRLKRTKSGGRVKVLAVPPEEFVISPECITPRDGFSAHRVKRTVSWLTQNGYEDAEDITSDDEFPGSPSAGGNIMQDARYALQNQTGNEFYTDLTGEGDDSQREVWLTECYLPVDYNGDGISEWRRVLRAGNRILENEECDGPPWATLCPVPIPHLFFGRSEAELAMPAQRIKTGILRNALDNLSFQTNARTYAIEGMVNLDDLLTNRPGGVVRMKQQGAAGPLSSNAADPAAAFQMLQYSDELKQDATGITKYTQGSDSDTLNKTAAGLQNITNRADMRVELIARIFAETGVKDLFWLMLKIASQYQDKPTQMRLTGKWVNVDPREWFNRFDMQVNVGLGTGNKDTAVAHLQQIMQLQQAGLQNGFCTPKNMYNAAAKLTAVLGFKDAGQFFTDPETLPPAPPPPPDPQVLAIQEQTRAAVAVEAAKNETERGKIQLQNQLDMQKTAADNQQKAQQAAADDARERDKTAAQMAIQREELLFKYGVHPMYEGITFISTFNQSAEAVGGQPVQRPNMDLFNGAPGMPAGAAMPMAPQPGPVMGPGGQQVQPTPHPQVGI